jgi:hypothetical protein
VKCLKRSAEKNKLDHFDFIEINSMKLSESRHLSTDFKVVIWENFQMETNMQCVKKRKKLGSIVKPRS